MPPRSSVRSDRHAVRHDRARPAEATRRPGYDRRPAADGDPADETRLLYRALLPLRMFLGATFLYAGIDKLVDPTFLRATGPGSIGDQLAGFVRVSPVAPLVHLFAQPAPVLVGLLIALAEIAIGIAALTGLLYRLSAAGGTALSLLFWLTASWATKPYYYGPDLPYALGWATLALAGHGGLLALDGRLAAWAGERIAGIRYGWPVPQAEIDEWTADPARRGFLQLAVIGGAAIAVGGVAGIIGRLRHTTAGVADVDRTPTASLDTGGGSPSPAASETPGASGTPAASDSTGGMLLASLDKLKPRHAVDFTDPGTGDPAVLVRLGNGTCVAFDAICTHAGCTVGYDGGSGFLLCPCHGAAFDPADHARPVAGPTDVPLPSLPIKVDQSTGRITLAG